VCICRFTLEHTESVWVYVGVHSQDKALECIQWECTQWVYVGEHSGFMYGLSFECTQSFSKCMQGPFGYMYVYTHKTSARDSTVGVYTVGVYTVGGYTVGLCRFTQWGYVGVHSGFMYGLSYECTQGFISVCRSHLGVCKCTLEVEALE